MFAHGTKKILALLGGLTMLAACGGGGGYSGGGGGGGGGPTGSDPGFYIVITGMTFSPAELAVPPGATVTVLNRSSLPHSVTSQATAGAFTPGAVAGIDFDTGVFGTGSQTFVIPADAAEGTAIPYYCRVHMGDMSPSSPTIRIDPSAQPAPAPGSSSVGGGGM
jgi:plastocyanin